ncbi:MAG: endo-1,4-beta-xylanase [Clostridia bacterium]|nr:endo-1,4-beta-xylanase [Clostridia bacterium]
MERWECRKSTAAIRFTDPAGEPLRNTKVRAELTKHEFLFGTGAFFTVPMTDPGTPAAQKEWLEKIYDLWKSTFNYGTMSFYLGRYEPEKGKTAEAETLRAAERMKADGKTMKGHPLCWHTVAAPWMYDMPSDEVLEYFKYRIRRELTAFRGKIGFWDVINEVVIMPEFVNEPKSMPRMNPVTRICREMGRVPLVKALFDEAHAVDPEAKLLINDFNTSKRYSRLVADCLDAGVGIDTIGIQSHQHQGFWGMEKLQEVTERFESFGLPIHYTENTFVSGHLMPPEIVDLNDYQVPEWPSTPEGEERQKEDLKTMAEYLFSRPLVEGFTNWNFEDHQWLGAPSGLIHSDGSPKKALLWLRDMLATEWHTDETMMTDENGFAVLHGFRGEYRLSAGDGKTAAFTLSKQTGETTVAF